MDTSTCLCEACYLETISLCISVYSWTMETEGAGGRDRALKDCCGESELEVGRGQGWLSTFCSGRNKVGTGLSPDCFRPSYAGSTSLRYIPSCREAWWLRHAGMVSGGPPGRRSSADPRASVSREEESGHYVVTRLLWGGGNPLEVSAVYLIALKGQGTWSQLERQV